MATDERGDYEGRCHCGAIGYVLSAARPPSKWIVRSCQCGFCRGHGARTTADSAASVRFDIRDAAKLNRYRFARRSLEFLVCSGCGGYIGALHTSARGQWATLNVNVMQPAPQVPETQPFTPDAANEVPLADKQAGREQRWTPVAQPI